MQRVGDSIVQAILKAQEDGEPEKVYRKVIVGKVVVKVIDPFSGERAELLIEGAPNKTPKPDLETALWTPLEVKYFEKMNKGLIEKGSIVAISKKSEDKIDYSNALSDEELVELAHERFFTMQAALKNITSETTLQRLVQVARDESRPSKTVQTMEERLEEVQQSG